MTSRLLALRDRFGPHFLLVVAVALAIIVPPATRASVWAWMLKGLNVMDVILIVGAFRLMSNVEHRRTLMQITGIGDKLDNGIKSRLEAIERRLGLRND